MNAFARDTVTLIAERAARLLAGLAVAVFCARVLGPREYGLYSYAVSLVVLFSFLGQAGLDQILVRELVRRDGAADQTLMAALSLRVVGSVGAGALALLTVSVASPPELPAALLVSLLALAGVLQTSHTIDAWLQAQQRFRASSAAKTVAVLLAAVARILAVLSSAPLLGLALVSIGEAALTGVLLGLAASRRGLRLRNAVAAFDREERHRLWLLARPMLASSFAVALYARADVFLLGQLSARSEVGQYSAAASLSEAFYLLPIALMTAASPRLAERYRTDEAAFRRECLALVRYSSLAGFCVALTLTALAEPLVAVVYGDAYPRTAQILAVHAWSTWMVFVSVASEPWYLQQGLQRAYLRKTMLAATANLLLNLWLIPRYGGVGAAIATVVSYALSAFGGNLLWRDTRGFFFRQVRAMLLLPLPRGRL